MAFRDRAWALLWVMGWAVAGCVSHPRPELAPAVAQAPERWVDAFAPPGGDGSQGQPFKALPPDLARGTRVHLRAGLYPGPFRLPPGVWLQGPKEAVLYADGEAEAVVSADAATLEGVSVQGGRTGLLASGEVRLSGVAFSGQRSAAVRVLSGGRGVLQGCALEGSVSQTRGVVVDASGTAQLDGCRFTGAFQRGVDVSGGRATIEHSSFTGAVEAVHVQGGEATLRSVDIGDGRGAGLFVAGGRLVLRAVHVTGHEFGLLTGQGATVAAEGLVSQRAQRAGLSLVKSKGTFTHLEVVQPGSYGAVQALDSEVTLTGATIRQATAAGVVVRRGRLSATDVDIDGVADEREADGSTTGGDGVHVRDAVAVLERVTVRDARGAGVYATSFAQVTAVDLRCERCQLGALLVERGAHLKALHVRSVGARGPALVVPDQATLEVEGLSVGTGEDVVWAECRQGAQVSLSGSLPPLDASACVHVR